MSGRSFLTASALGLVVLLSCADRRDVWSLSETAIDSLQLDSAILVPDPPPTDDESLTCKAILEVQGPDVAGSSLDTSGLREWMGRAKKVDLICRGSCGSETNCKVHNLVAYVDAQSARTGCICLPKSPPPCRLLATWVIGKETRRRIESVSCGSPEESEISTECTLNVHRSQKGLSFTCEAR